MNLLVVSTWFPFPPNNGSKIRSFHLLQELSTRYEVTLLSFTEPGDEQHLSVLRPYCKTIETVPGNPTKVAATKLSSLFGEVPRSYQEAFSPAMDALARKHLPQSDVAMALQIASSLYLRGGGPPPRLLEELEVSILRDPVLRESRPIPRLRRQLTWWKLANFARRLVTEFDHTTVVSDLERDCLVSLGCDEARISVVPNAVDGAHLTRVRGPVDSDQIIYPGALTYGPNFDAVEWFLAEVLPLIHRVRPNTKLVVTGSVEGVDLGRLPKAEHVQFPGYVADIKAVVASCAACIVPLRLGGGTRLKILEAMALGTPVVSTSKGAEGLDVTPGKDLLVADTPEAFARAVVDVLDSSGLAESLRASARALIARQYTWQHAGARLCDQLDQLTPIAHGHRTH